MNTRFGMGIVLGVLFLSASAVPVESSQVSPDPTLEDALRAFLDKPELADDPTTRYIAVPADLNGDGQDEQVIYVMGDRWCGSGGCTTVVVRRDGASWEIVSRIRVTEAPVWVLETQNEGWRSLAVPVTGAGPKPDYVAELQFDGSSYPGDPTTSGPRPIDGPPVGEVLIPVPGPNAGRPLYP